MPQVIRIFLYFREEYNAGWAWHFLQEVSGSPRPVSWWAGCKPCPVLTPPAVALPHTLHCRPYSHAPSHLKAHCLWAPLPACPGPCACAQLWKEENSFDPYSFFGGGEPEAPKEPLTESKVFETLDFVLQ